MAREVHVSRRALPGQVGLELARNRLRVLRASKNFAMVTVERPSMGTVGDQMGPWMVEEMSIWDLLDGSCWAGIRTKDSACDREKICAGSCATS